MDTQMAPGVSLFASRDDTGKHLVLIALNLDGASSARASIELTGCGPLRARRKFVYAQGASSLADQGSKTGGVLDEALAPYSINVFDITLE